MLRPMTANLIALAVTLIVLLLQGKSRFTPTDRGRYRAHVPRATRQPRCLAVKVPANTEEPFTRCGDGKPQAEPVGEKRVVNTALMLYKNNA